MWLSKLRVAAIVPALVAACLGLATSAQAQSRTCPFELEPNQQDGVCANLTSGGAVAVRFPTEAFGEAINFGFSPPFPNFTVGIVYLTYPGEPGIPGLTGSPANTSDALALRNDDSDPQFPLTQVSFISDGASADDIAQFLAATAGFPVLGTIQETGIWQDVSTYFGLSSGSLFVQSDVDVPEPVSLALLGTALAGLLLAGTIRRIRPEA